MKRHSLIDTAESESHEQTERYRQTMTTRQDKVISAMAKTKHIRAPLCSARALREMKTCVAHVV